MQYNFASSRKTISLNIIDGTSIILPELIRFCASIDTSYSDYYLGRQYTIMQCFNRELILGYIIGFFCCVDPVVFKKILNCISVRMKTVVGQPDVPQNMISNQICIAQSEYCDQPARLYRQRGKLLRLWPRKLLLVHYKLQDGAAASLFGGLEEEERKNQISPNTRMRDRLGRSGLVWRLFVCEGYSLIRQNFQVEVV